MLNGAIAAALFNLIYDLVLSQKVKWYAMCPVVDFMNHNSSIQVSSPLTNRPSCLPAFMPQNNFFGFLVRTYLLAMYSEPCVAKIVKLERALGLQ